MFRFLLLALAAAVTGCSLPEFSVEQARGMSNLELCQSYSYAKQINDSHRLILSKNELINRKAVTSRDLEDMAKGLIRNNMKEHVAICSWGPYQSVNRTVVSGSETKQFVISLGTYVYTRNGRVYAWQD